MSNLNEGAANGRPAEGPFSIVCLSSQRWNHALPTNRQQIMLRAARRGHRVLFVETAGFAGRRLLRAVQGKERFLRAAEVAPRVEVRPALNVVPWGRKYRLAQRVNCRLNSWLLRRHVRRLPEPAVLWLYDPCAAPMAGASGERIAVYDCVDDHVQYTLGDRRRALVRASDERASREAGLVFATTRPLYERHRHLNARTHLVPNAGDYHHFVQASDRSLAAEEVRDLPRPVIGFAGNLLTGKVDFELLERVAARRPDWSLLLVGPAQPGSEDALKRLTQLSNVRWVGLKPYPEVPRYVAAFDVGLCPYLWNDWMRSGFPLKLYEYLAAGKPVVASGNPDLAGMEPDVALVRGEDAFVSAIDAALGRAGEQDKARRQATAARNTWDTRVEKLLGLVAGELAR